MAAIDVDAVVPPADREKLQARFERGIADLPERFKPVLLHNDIRPVHLFVEPETGSLTGVIDYADATLGPAELDVFYLWLRWWRPWGAREDGDFVLASYAETRAMPTDFYRTAAFMRFITAVDRSGSTRPEVREQARAEVKAYLES